MVVSSSDAMTYPYATHAAGVFHEIARTHADRPALVWSAEDHTTYRELDRASSQLARLLVHRGVRKRDIVALCLEKSPLVYSGILACLKVGAPYVVIDPSNPPERTRSIVERCAPALAVVDPAVARPAIEADVFGCATLLTDDQGRLAELTEMADDPFTPPWSVDGSDPAYVMFTSGSTGTPKGAVMSQSNLVNFIRWSRAEFDTQPADVFTNLNPLFFDNSVFDIYASLFSGASLVPFTAAALKVPADVVSRIGSLGCTSFFSVPSLLVYFQTLKLIDRHSFPALKRIVFGGEGYPKPMLARLYEQVGDRIALYNVYGPTECTCICSVYRIGADDLRDPTGYPPLGSLIPGFSQVIVDSNGAPSPEGAVGELCLGGPCVGLGYLDDAEQTDRAFVQNPTHRRFFDRVYRTGDLVRLDPTDGKLHFAGRADSQIKHQGYRIELGEIEHAMASMAGVDEAVAVHVTAGDRSRIVGVVASRQLLAAPDVKAFVRRALPPYMVPERVVVVTQLLKNANGKVDRRGIHAAVERGDYA
jgi:D-alanine--poly(phosphoribitol) ligase subunit 1